MPAAPVGRLYCSSSSLTVHVFDVLWDAHASRHFPPKFTKLPTDVGKIGAFRNDYGSLLVELSCQFLRQSPIFHWKNTKNPRHALGR
jgi:hypothetical protein